MRLDTYRRKRDFRRTPEPSGAARHPSRGRSFVIQKHAARRLHYDFRLELDGVLKSWAVPKGPSLDPGDKRLAVHVEDHPLEYGSFEGVIPEGQYGAGTVKLWDRGVWIPEGDPGEGYTRGKLKFRLEGRRLRGGWTLVRMRGNARNGKQNWLLIKERDSTAAQAAPKPSAAPTEKQRPTHEDKAPGDVVRERAKAPAARASATRGGRPVRARGSDQPVRVAGVPLTHPDRVLYPAQRITKRDLASFYQEIGDWILPHIARRPLSLVRCPEGHDKECFYQRHAGAGTPDRIKRIQVDEKDGVRTYLYVEDLPGLISLVQLGVLELHPWGARVADLEHPDRLTLDLDPSPEVPWKRVVEAARQIRSLLSELELTAFLKTTGGKGMHVVVPLAPKQPWALVKAFARAIAESTARRAPRDYTLNLSKGGRKGKIFIDYLRNSQGATAVAAYSTRARAGAPVSTPVGWDELSADLRSDQYTVENLPRRLAALKKDPWEGYLSLRQTIPDRTKKAGASGDE